MLRMLNILTAMLAVLLMLNGAVWMVLGKVNAGTLLPLGLGVGLAAWLLFRRRWQGWLAQARWRRWCWRLVLLLFAVWLAGLLAFMLQLARHGGSEPATPAPLAIVVLGSGLEGREPAPLLRARLDRARQLAQQHPHSLLIVSGGQGWSEEISEAEAMQAYLLRHGVAAARIRQEDRSTSTEENLLYSARVLQSAGVLVSQQPVWLVTSDFHVLRAQRIARAAGYGEVAAIGAPTPLPVRYNAWLREYLAWLSSWLLGEL
ncbi:YdcF family protein [Chitinilyticum litopenaei]|uniref:YdcF family protein n=1 Tax=Chitinilyticum litopenaei TaxID=1121276 RepID=UPI0005BCC557|nr:YdcF family protein [Chitinilyticum litopenaei]